MFAIIAILESAVFFVIFFMACSNAHINEVILQVYNFDELTGHFSEYNPMFIDNSTVILGPKPSIRIECLADSHISWKAPDQITDIRFAIDNRYMVEPEQVLYMSSLWTKLEYFNTGRFSCTSSDNDEKGYYIYILGQSANETFVNESGGLVQDKVIRCRVTNPHIDVCLYRYSRGIPYRVNNVKYDPQIGFVLPEKGAVDGTYFCAANEARTANFVVPKSERIQYHPAKKSIRKFVGVPLKVNCTSHDSTQNKLSYKVYTTNFTKSYAGNDIFDLNALALDIKEGIITCEAPNGKAVHTWHFKIIKKPELEFVKITGSVICYASSLDIQLRNLKCENPSQCSIRKFCLQEKSDRCRDLMFEGSLCRPGNCSRLIHSHHSGIIYCQNEGVYIEAEYFTGLNRLRYFDWRNAPITALVQIDEVNSTIYVSPERSNSFYCEATGFLFMNEIQFAIRYQNDTVRLVTEDMAIDDDSAMNRIAANIIARGMLMNLTEEMVELICMAPWINATNTFLNVSRRFHVKREIPPTLKGTSENEFTKGDKGRTILCQATGQPPPELKWLSSENKPVSEPFSTTLTSEGGIYLNFPEVTNEYDGTTFVCKAKNSQGSESKNFTVKVVDPNSSTSAQNVVITFGILIPVIMSIVGILLYRKNLQLKKCIRDLTEQEVNEFFHGNSQLVNPKRLLNENAQHLPYDKSYEIPKSDLILDEVEVLGSGEFGVVFKGLYGNKPVAIKTTKSNADIIYFKSLLSELKVMMYLGKHPYIVDCLGFCTENIKTRTVFIVMEFCSLGNLNEYIRIGKIYKQNDEKSSKWSHSVKLQDTSNSINANGNLVTLANMLTWCLQIASGMSHLETKKVIHGDLATRNILIFPGNVVKISDFGLSKQLYEYSQQQRNKKQAVPLPWRWMAIETMRDLSFTFKSDVWAYGVTLWEIFSFGRMPYSNKEWDEEFMEDLTMGMRLKCPRHCPTTIYEIMTDCWDINPLHRPTFLQLVWRFESEVSQTRIGNGV